MAKMELKGTKLFRRNIRIANKLIQEGGDLALVKGIKHVFDESQKIVPVDTEKLKKSGTYSRYIQREGSRAGSVNITYYAPYAIYVHEDLTARHASGKSAKYVEIPMMANINKIKANIRREARRKLKANRFKLPSRRRR